MKYILDIETTGLDPLNDEVTAIGIKPVGKKPIIFIRDSNNTEGDILHAFSEWLPPMLSAAKFITHNGISFDFPFLLIRGYVYDIDLRELKMHDNMDTMKITSRWISLNDMAKILNVEQKSGKGSFAPKLFKEGRINELRRYLEQDLKVTENVYLKLKELKTL